MSLAGKRYVPYAILAVVTFAAYSNIFGNQLLFDDDLIIHLNTYLRSWDTFGNLFTASTTEGAHIPGGFYRPMQLLTYFFIYQFQSLIGVGGEFPVGFHILNLSLHIANVCLGYRLGRRLGLDWRAAFLGMMVWSVHPLHVEAVTYMSATADTMHVMFMLWALNLIFPEPTQRKVLYATPLLLLAFLSKETSVVLPALTVVCLYFISPGRYKLRTYVVTWPLWAVALGYLAWRVNSTSFDGPARYATLTALPAYNTLKLYNDDIVMRIYTFLATLPSYAEILIWPVGLHMERAFLLYDQVAPIVVGGLLMFVAAVALAIWGAHRERALPLAWGILWFAVAHFPNTGIMFAMNSLFLEHWMYLPTIGFSMGIAETILRFFERRKNITAEFVALGCVLAIIVVLAARTFDQNFVWREPIVFYNNIFDNHGISPRGRNNLAIAYTQHGDIPRAIEQYQQAIKESDTYAEAHYNLALAYLQMADLQTYEPRAITELKRSLEIEPRFYRSYLALAIIAKHHGDIIHADMYDRKAHDLIDNWTQ